MSEQWLVLKCLSCKEKQASWEKSMFLSSRLRKEYLKQGYVWQACGCDGEPNQKHIIVGIESSKRITKDQVTRMLKRY